MRVPQRIAAALLAGAMSLSLAIAASAAKPAKGQKAATAAVTPAILSKLDLTADQQAKLKDATTAFQADQKKAQDLTNPKDKRQALTSARLSYQTAVKGVLTPEQQQKLQGLLKEAAEYKSLGPMGNNLVGMNLTDDQKDKVKAIGVKYEPEIAKLRAEQKSATDKKAVRTEMADLQRKMGDEVKAVLTPEQLSQMPKAKGKAKAKKNNQ